MQAYKFSNGGYVAHNVRFFFRAGKFSIWYAADGSVLSIEAFDKLGRASRRVSASVQREAPLMFARVKLCADMTA
jgi:hypothetical protein